MAIDRNADDLKDFFSFISRPHKSLKTLLESYYDYHGLMNFGHRTKMVEEVKLVLKEDNSSHALQHSDIIGQNGEVRPEFVAKWCPGLDIPYFKIGDVDRLEKIRVFEESINEWQSDILPQPYNMRMQSVNRPPLDIFHRRGGQLFVSANGHEYFDIESGCFWPEASSRAYGLGLLKYPHFAVSNPVVIVQDQFDGTNFAHFLYDYLPRIIYFCELTSEDLKTVVFFVGGKCTPFHELLISILCERFRLSKDQFIFDLEREIWNIKNSIYFFSDQKNITHPLHICYPETMKQLRRALSKLPIEFEGEQKIYISRRDAPMRALSNDEEVSAAVKAVGYTAVVMSDFDALSQISLLANARAVVAPHGMGLTNIFFNQKGAEVLELFSPAMGSDAYALVCASSALNYKFLIGNSSDEKLNYKIDIEQLRTCIAL